MSTFFAHYRGRIVLSLQHNTMPTVPSGRHSGEIIMPRLAFLAFALIGVSLASFGAKTAKENEKREGVRKRFEDLAAKLTFFPTGEFVYGRGDRLSRQIPVKVTEPWLKILAAISTGKEDAGDLVSL